jgi:hypothetical protein
MNLGVWVGAISTIAVYSYLYKENPLFRALEYILIGLTVGQLSVAGYNNILDMAVKPLAGGKLIAAFPIILGVLLYMRWIKGAEWLSRIPIAFMVSVAATLTITGQIQASVIQQIRATMVPMKGINDFLVMLGVVGTLCYFFFVPLPGDSADGKTKGVLSQIAGLLAVVGRYTMMVAFGAAFGAGVMSRIGLFIGRLQFLFQTWIPLIK